MHTPGFNSLHCLQFFVRRINQVGFPIFNELIQPYLTADWWNTQAGSKFVLRYIDWFKLRLTELAFRRLIIVFLPALWVLLDSLDLSAAFNSSAPHIPQKRALPSTGIAEYTGTAPQLPTKTNHQPSPPCS